MVLSPRSDARRRYNVGERQSRRRRCRTVRQRLFNVVPVVRSRDIIRRAVQLHTIDRLYE